MTTTSILYDAAGSVARLTLNRPDVLNSFDAAMGKRMQEILAEVARDEKIRAVYLTGAGRAFSAGQDLAEAAPKEGKGLEDFAAHVRAVYNPIVRAIRAMPKPVVCGVNGVAAGAGANLALACDFVVAAEEASFIQAFIKIGLVPDTGGSWFLPRLVGSARAAALLMLGDKLPAKEAESLGLIYKAVPRAALDEFALGLAARLAALPTYALGLIKRMLDGSATNSLAQQLELEAECQGLAGRSADYAEGVRAFLAKREPIFTGK